MSSFFIVHIFCIYLHMTINNSNLNFILQIHLSILSRSIPTKIHYNIKIYVTCQIFDTNNNIFYLPCLLWRLHYFSISFVVDSQFIHTNQHITVIWFFIPSLISHFVVKHNHRNNFQAHNHLCQTKLYLWTTKSEIKFYILDLSI